MRHMAMKARSVQVSAYAVVVSVEAEVEVGGWFARGAVVPPRVAGGGRGVGARRAGCESPDLMATRCTGPGQAAMRASAMVARRTKD